LSLLLADKSAVGAINRPLQGFRSVFATPFCLADLLRINTWQNWQMEQILRHKMWPGGGRKTCRNRPGSRSQTFWRNPQNEALEAGGRALLCLRGWRSFSGRSE